MLERLAFRFIFYSKVVAHTLAAICLVAWIPCLIARLYLRLSGEDVSIDLSMSLIFLPIIFALAFGCVGMMLDLFKPQDD